MLDPSNWVCFGEILLPGPISAQRASYSSSLAILLPSMLRKTSNELDQRMRVVSRAKPTESSGQSSRDALSRPAMISNECCVSNTKVSRVAQTRCWARIFIHPSHLTLPNRAEWRPIRRRCARFARLSRIRDHIANKSVPTRAKPLNILCKGTRPSGWCY